MIKRNLEPFRSVKKDYVNFKFVKFHYVDKAFLNLKISTRPIIFILNFNFSFMCWMFCF